MPYTFHLDFILLMTGDQDLIQGFIFEICAKRNWCNDRYGEKL